MTKIEKAKALINTFTNNDIELAKSLLTPNYIQHNLDFQTGREAFINAVQYLNSAPIKTTVKTIREFQDGDYVFLHNVYNFAGQGDVVAFDVFRFEDDLIAEHWDNIQPLGNKNPSGHTQIDGVISTTKSSNENTKEIVSNFVNDVLHGKNLQNITNYFDKDNYTQHNIDIADGLSGLSNALEQLAKQGINMVYSKTYKVLVDNNFSLVLSEGTFGNKPMAYFDLFRVENNKIVEHWDVMQEIPNQSEWKNSNGKF